MTYQAFTHIALTVTPLRQAEEFYRTLFALDIAFREAEAADGWYTLPSDAGWDDAEAAGISLGLCSLLRLRSLVYCTSTAPSYAGTVTVSCPFWT
jgi:catechol 2,3-dioxygenase-like lactoylglutathione lyase family enzyme